MADEEPEIRQRRLNNDVPTGQSGQFPTATTSQTMPTSTFYSTNAIPGWTNVGVSASAPSYRTAGEYAQAVQQWMWQYQMWHSLNWFNMTFPFYAMSCMGGQQGQPPMGTGQAGVYSPLVHANGNVPGAAGPGVGQGVAAAWQPVPPVAGAAGPTDAQHRQGREYRIPSLWKRIVAEFIDFFLLFLIKLGVTIMTVEYIGIIDLHKYDLDILLNHNMDYNAAYDAMFELIVMEVINRVLICIFETLCLRKGVAGQVGGTTPGKRIMGLRVVSCDEIQDLPGNRIRVIPAQDIGVWNALVRSVIKNFSLAFFFPVCFTVFFFQHNRAAYDIITNSMVVEVTEEDLALGR